MAKDNRLQQYQEELKHRENDHSLKDSAYSVATGLGIVLTVFTGCAAVGVPVVAGALSVNQVYKRTNYQQSNDLLKDIIKSSSNAQYENAAYEVAEQAFQKSGLYLGEKTWTRRVFPQKTVYILGGVLLALYEVGLEQKEIFIDRLADYLKSSQKQEDNITRLIEFGRKKRIHFETEASDSLLIFSELTGKDEPTSEFYQKIAEKIAESKYIREPVHANGYSRMQ